MDTKCVICKTHTNYDTCKKCKSWYCEKCHWVEDSNNIDNVCNNCESELWCYMCKNTITSYPICRMCEFCHDCDSYFINRVCKCNNIICPRCRYMLFIDEYFEVCNYCHCKKCDSELIVCDQTFYCITCKVHCYFHLL
jgi:hypothetical protein